MSTPVSDTGQHQYRRHAGATAARTGKAAPTVRPFHQQRRLARQLPVLRAALQRQRAFRAEQLAYLDAHRGAHIALIGYRPRGGRGNEARALAEVRAKLAAGARRALADIELALRRMDTGQYGRCRGCGRDITLAVLTAIPRSTLCLSCHRQCGEATQVAS